MRSRICSLDGHNNGWPWVTLNGDFMVPIARYICGSWASCRHTRPNPQTHQEVKKLEALDRTQTNPWVHPTHGHLPVSSFSSLLFGFLCSNACSQIWLTSTSPAICWKDWFCCTTPMIGWEDPFPNDLDVSSRALNPITVAAGSCCYYYCNQTM